MSDLHFNDHISTTAAIVNQVDTSELAETPPVKISNL